MKASWRSVAIVPVLGIALVLSSCSGDQAGLITSPSNDLNRRVPLAEVKLPLESCRVKALDFFGIGSGQSIECTCDGCNGGRLPFVTSCEDMNDACVQVLSEEYNEGGCVVSVHGMVSFPGTSGHTYNFTATTSDCQHDGGMLEVCSTQLDGCVEVVLPRLQIVEPRQARNSMN